MRGRHGTIVCAVVWVLCAAGAAAAAPEEVGPEAPAPVAGLPGQLLFAVGAGQVGSGALYQLELAYFPAARFGLEASLGHNPGHGTYAALHQVSALVPLLPWRKFRPFARAGLGTFEVFPGTAINAQTVTKLVGHAGGGAWLRLQDAVALRFEGSMLGFLDDQEGGRGLLGAAQWSVGITFCRDLGSTPSADTGEGS